MLRNVQGIDYSRGRKEMDCWNRQGHSISGHERVEAVKDACGQEMADE